MKFPGVFLRMDGNGVTTFNGKNLGTVNCQFGAYECEYFRLNKQTNGSFTIESVAFPGVFLRMDGNNVKAFGAKGAGSVTCQFTARSWEEFRIETDSTPSNLKKYGYDMVVAVTQESVNEVMKQYMIQHEQKEYLLVLKGEMDEETEVTTYVPVDPAKIGMDKIKLLLETPATKSERTQK